MLLHVVGGLLMLSVRTTTFTLRPSKLPKTACRAAATGDTPQRKVALLVEPTPFTHVSGYANRFKEQLKYLKEFGDEVAVATPDDKPPLPDSVGPVRPPSTGTISSHHSAG